MVIRGLAPGHSVHRRVVTAAVYHDAERVLLSARRPSRASPPVPLQDMTVLSSDRRCEW
jgi:hypothetical protein